MTSKLSASKSFGLIPVDCIQGTIFLISTDVAVEWMGAHALHKRQIDSFFDNYLRRSQRTFYMNRFHRFKNDAYDILSKDEPSDEHIESTCLEK